MDDYKQEKVIRKKKEEDMEMWKGRRMMGNVKRSNSSESSDHERMHLFLMKLIVRQSC